MELLLDVAVGIGELAQRELQEPADPQPTGMRRSASASSGMLSMPRLQRALTAPAPDVSRSVVVVQGDSPNDSRQSSVSGDDPSSMTEPDKDRPFSRRARHYGIKHFRAIRESFGISPTAYARAFPNDLSELAGASWRQRVKESVSEGASGSFFYRVNGSGANGTVCRYIIKQVTKREKNQLLRLLPKYREHVEERSGQTMIQYLGCHSMSLWWKFSGRVYFVVMRNFFPVGQWLTFDLKGCTANRRALATSQLHQHQTHFESAGEDRHNTWGTLRDWEWMDIAMVCDVPHEHKVKLAETVKADTKFLSAQGQLDYSLLVGIHRVSHDGSPSEREAKLEELESCGGYISLDRQRVYFFGIIDILEGWNLRWEIQRAVLTVANHLTLNCDANDGISALAPGDYADRFLIFALQEVFQLPCPKLQDSSAARSARACSKCSRCGRCAQTCCSRQPVSARSGSERWSHLWDQRRRGLVRERIEAERADHLRRIKDLEFRNMDLEAQLSCLPPLPAPPAVESKAPQR